MLSCSSELAALQISSSFISGQQPRPQVPIYYRTVTGFERRNNQVRKIANFVSRTRKGGGVNVARCVGPCVNANWSAGYAISADGQK